jgi:hypothetical protein
VSKLPRYQRCGICLVSLLHKMINLACDNIWNLNNVDEFWIIHNSIQFKHPSGGSFPSPKPTLLSTSLQQHMKNECWRRQSILLETFIMLVFLTNHGLSQIWHDDSWTSILHGLQPLLLNLDLKG